MSGRYERELVNALHEIGYGAIRIPSSGSSTERSLPDVLAGRPTDQRGVNASVVAVEHKSTSQTTAYVNTREVDALREFATRFGATPLLAVRYTSMGTPTDHYFVAPGDARMTDEDNYGLPIADIDDRAAYTLTSGDDPHFRGRRI